MNYSYIAGFFDGEGSILWRGKNKARIVISIAQTNEEVLKKIVDFINAGTVIKEKKRKKHWKDCWVFRIGKQIEVRPFLRNIFPFLIVKKGLAQKALICLEKYFQTKSEQKEIVDKRKQEGLILVSKRKSYREIGKILGISRTLVYHWVIEQQKNGL